ncbi:MAG: hypothetical protein B7Z75_07010 [Acidocella sp. 20-57-95]|nr:MAG: hypothetical protein B7Z75_07010 [Acidocella sp. 20-57-95]OYV61237.1 MAG: hypothetical protein B7Z71_04965 [Acidocella sp. 21-58-7]
MPGQTSTVGVVKQMLGMLWYNLLADMNKSGLAPATLGTGADAFQNLFLWNIAQNDFSKYDATLSQATVKQLGTPAPVTPSSNFMSGSSISPPLVMAPANLGDRPQQASMPEQAVKFAQSIWPSLKDASAKLGVPAVAMLAQAALETGWGSAANGNNLFGIKAAVGQAGTVRATQEMIDGVITPQSAAFKNYTSLAASISDYVSHIQSVFGNVVGQSGVEGYAQALQAAGYATDSQYAAKIISIAHSPLMGRILQSLN